MGSATWYYSWLLLLALGCFEAGAGMVRLNFGPEKICAAPGPTCAAGRDAARLVVIAL